MESLQTIDQGWQIYGALGAFAMLLTTAVGLFKQPVIQNILPTKMRWISFKPITKVAVIFAGACAGSGLLAYLGGVSVVSAIGLGISAGFAAIGVRETKETLTTKSELIPKSEFRNTSLRTSLDVPLSK